MSKRLKELIVDEEGHLREKSGEIVDVTPVGYPIGLKIPYSDFDKRKFATFIKNFMVLHQPQCENLPGIPKNQMFSPKMIDYYLVNLTGQRMGSGGFDLDFNAEKVVDFDTQGKRVTQYEDQQSRHHLGAIQFYKKK